MQLTPAQQETLDIVRGDPTRRPTVAPGLRNELQSALDEATADIDIRLVITKNKLNKVHQCEGHYMAIDNFSWRPANARGTIAHKAIELSVGGVKQVHPTALVDMAIRRLCEDPISESLAEYLRKADDAERAELRSAATDLVIGFLEMFPPLQPHWIPHSEASTKAFTGPKKNIDVRGKIDLKLGALTAHKANTVIVDMKTGSPSFTDLDDLRLYALLETLRTGVPPFQWANVYVAAGRTEAEQLSEAILWTTMRRLIDGIVKIARLERATARPVLTPGMGCRFCPERETCSAAASELRDQDDFALLSHVPT
jgi:hypothetical protein